MTIRRVCLTTYSYRHRLDLCGDIVKLLVPRIAESGEHPPGALRRQAARARQSMAMFEHAIRTNAHRQRQNEALTRTWLLVGVEGIDPMLTEAVFDWLKIFLGESVRLLEALGTRVCRI